LSSHAVAPFLESLSHALSRSAEQADVEAAHAEGARKEPEETGLNDQWDKLLAKFAMEEEKTAELPMEDSGNLGFSSAETDAMVASLRERAMLHRAVVTCITGLLPCLLNDPASSRLVAALAMLEVGAHDGIKVKVGPQLCEAGTPMQAISSADACWALCSEKRQLIVDNLLPSVLTKGQWSWQELRRTGLGWWLAGSSGTALADMVVARLLQSATAQLRSASSQPALVRTDSSIDRRMKGLVDEMFFWCVLSGAKLARLRALVKTGILKAEPAVATLLEHPRSSDAQFLRKNAFRLLSIHRFHLAASLFMLCGSHDEAARVVAHRLQDIQLLLLVTRHCPDIATPLLHECLRELSLTAGRDAWLHFLLLWHAGDREAALHSAAEAASTCSLADEEVNGNLFDGALRLSLRPEGLQEVSQKIACLHSGA
jgi:hypothetical protein